MMERIIKMQLTVSSFFKREDGASAIEYAIIAGLIAVAIITAATAVGTGVTEMFDKIAEVLGAATAKAP